MPKYQHKISGHIATMSSEEFASLSDEIQLKYKRVSNTASTPPEVKDQEEKKAAEPSEEVDTEREDLIARHEELFNKKPAANISTEKLREKVEDAEQTIDDNNKTEE